jgi:periplasmic copper chaperone A
MKWRSGWISCTLAAAFAVLPTIGFAHDYELGNLRIKHPHARATVPGARTGGVYLTIDNASNTTDRLLRASTPIAAGAAVHQTVMEDGMMKMRAVPSVEIRPGGRLEMKRDGYHLMLLDLKQPLREGDSFPMTLTFERGGTVTVSVQVDEMIPFPGEKR